MANHNVFYRFIGIFVLLFFFIFVLMCMDSQPSPRYQLYPITTSHEIIKNMQNVTSHNDRINVLYHIKNILLKNIENSNKSHFFFIKNSTLERSLYPVSLKKVKFLLELGVFDDGLLAKMNKAQVDNIGLSSFIVKENEKFILRSGPYDDRYSAQKALEKFSFSNIQ